MSERHPDDQPRELTPILRAKIVAAVGRYQKARTDYYTSKGGEAERRRLKAAGEDLECADYVEALMLKVEELEAELGIRDAYASSLLKWIHAYTEALDCGMTERAKTLLAGGWAIFQKVLEEEADQEALDKSKRGLSG